MYYICRAHDKSISTEPFLEIEHHEPLVLSPRLKSLQVGNERLVLSPSNGGWCYLNSREWNVALSINGQGINEFAQSLNLPISLIERFVKLLVQRGILISPSTRSDDYADRKKQNSRFILTFLLSNQCNLACEYCYHAFSKQNKKGNITPFLANLALQYAFDQPTDELMIDFGEIATSEKNFFQLLDDSKRLQEKKSKHTIYAIQTNGTTLTRKMASLLKQNHIFVGLSLDGPADLHDQMRRYPAGMGSYSKANVGLENLIELEIPFIVNATIHRMNFQHLKKILDHFREMNILHFVFKPILNRGNAVLAWEKIGLSFLEYHDFLCEMVAEAIDHRNLDCLDTTFITLLQRAMGDIRGWSSSCYSGFCQKDKAQLVVNADGFCYPCPRYSSIGKGRFCLGSIQSVALCNDASMEMIETSRETKSFLSPKCRNCLWVSYCGGGCPLEVDRADEPNMCSITSKMYELIFSNIIPKLRSGEFIRSNKLGDIQVVDEDFFNRDKWRKT